MMPKFVFLATDLVLYALLAALGFYLWRVFRSEELRARWSKALSSTTAVVCMTLLSVFLLIAALDSVHFRPAIEARGEAISYDVRTVSLLDKILVNASRAEEKTYSEPFALRTFEKISRLENGRPVRDFEPLKAAGKHLKRQEDRAADIAKRSLLALAVSLLVCTLFWGAATFFASAVSNTSFMSQMRAHFKGERTVPYEAGLAALSVVITLGIFTASLWPYYHALGTDQTGNDVLYQALKSIRTAVVIGSLATLTTLPFAVVLGISAGFFKGRTDDVIQYIYTTLSSIPSVLLIAASVLMIQVFIDSNPGLYATALERADLRLFILSIIIGLTGWATLARLLRAETLKISELDYIQAAHAFGLSPWKVMSRHILPNVVHIVLIVAVLDFSGIVLYEAVLSYVGVGVDPLTHSFGSMINAGRLELSRSPLVWWNLAAAFVLMLTLVLSANLFASAVRNAFDPRTPLRIARKGKGAGSSESEAAPKVSSDSLGKEGATC